MTRHRTKRRSNSCLGAFLALILLAGAVLVVLIGIPILARSVFGPPSTTLTIVQKIQYSSQILLAKNALTTTRYSNSPQQEFSIEMGQSINEIATHLENAGLISDAGAFRNYLIYKGYDTQIKAGTHLLTSSSTPVQIAEQILNVYNESVPFSILPGWRAEEIAEALPTSGINVTPDEFMAVARDPGQIGLGDYLPKGASLEGYMFPGEYLIRRDVSPQELALTFVLRFQSQVGPEIRQQIESRGLTFHQGIILASIIQRETFDDSERATIASVFYNRLAAGWKLETDPTVQYSLGYNSSWGGWWKSPLSSADLTINSPFNTYIIDGLPPAPISNPSLASILAVARPEATDYFYFRAKCDGSGLHVFARTFEEHVANACP